MNDFAKRLRIIRKKKGLTQKQLAVEVGEQLVQCIFRFGHVRIELIGVWEEIALQSTEVF